MNLNETVFIAFTSMVLSSCAYPRYDDPFRQQRLTPAQVDAHNAQVAANVRNRELHHDRIEPESKAREEANKAEEHRTSGKPKAQDVARREAHYQTLPPTSSSSPTYYRSDEYYNRSDLTPAAKDQLLQSDHFWERVTEELYKKGYR